MAERFVAIPLLMFSAPLLSCATPCAAAASSVAASIRHDATVIAGLWSLMSGTAVVTPLQALLGV
jgi:hypothetical protein